MSGAASDSVSLMSDLYFGQMMVDSVISASPAHAVPLLAANPSVTRSACWQIYGERSDVDSSMARAAHFSPVGTLRRLPGQNELTERGILRRDQAGAMLRNR
jgi:hypothetical protein